MGHLNLLGDHTWKKAPAGPYAAEARPSSVLSVREFAFYQRRNSDRCLSELERRAWEAYCFALTLLDPASSLSAMPAADLGGVMIAWDLLCAGYREHKLEQQFHLFLPHDESEMTRWSAFVEDQCFRPILGSPHLTRSLLCATGMVKGSLKQRAAGQSSITSFLAGIAAACCETVPFSRVLQTTCN